MKKQTLPIFLEDVNQIGRNQFLTKRQIRECIMQNVSSELLERYCIFKKFNRVTGEIDKKYAWHSIIDELNRSGESDAIIKQLLWT